jgi:glutathione peroxidase
MQKNLISRKKVQHSNPEIRRFLPFFQLRRLFFPRHDKPTVLVQYETHLFVTSFLTLPANMTKHYSRRLLSLSLLAGLGFGTQAYAQTSSPAACPATLNYTVARLQDEAPQNLCQYAGKVILAVNTASYCGFTSQYEGLEQLYAKYKDRGLVVLGFASNDFGQQEPGANKEIAEFCHNTYGVKFPMFAKSSVIGPNINPFYKSLLANGATTPKWNFHKILLDRNGKVVESYPSKVTPADKKLVADIEKALTQK